MFTYHKRFTKTFRDKTGNVFGNIPYQKIAGKYEIAQLDDSPTPSEVEQRISTRSYPADPACGIPNATILIHVQFSFDVSALIVE